MQQGGLVSYLAAMLDTGCAGEGGQSVGALPYSGSVAGQQAAPVNEPAQGTGAFLLH